MVSIIVRATIYASKTSCGKKRNELLENMKVKESFLKSCLVRYRKMCTDPNVTNTQDLLLNVVIHLEDEDLSRD